MSTVKGCRAEHTQRHWLWWSSDKKFETKSRNKTDDDRRLKSFCEIVYYAIQHKLRNDGRIINFSDYDRFC